MIAPARPGAQIRSGEQGIDFRTREELDQGTCKTFAGNSEHPLDLRRVIWYLKRCIPKEGMKRGEPQIPAANAQAVMFLDVIEKRHN